VTDNPPAYTDPPGMPGDERMDPAELKVVREFLGLTGEALAAHLGVSSRTVRHWEEGRYAIPDGVRLAVEDLEQRTAEWVAGLVDRIHDIPEPVVVVYRSDVGYWTAHPEQRSEGFTAQWHRAVIARVAQEVPGLGITYAAG
jgi:hypothetical protein